MVGVAVSTVNYTQPVPTKEEEHTATTALNFKKVEVKNVNICA